MKKRNLFKILGVSAICCAASLGAYSAIKAEYEPKQANAEIEYYSYYNCHMKNAGLLHGVIAKDSGKGIEGGEFIGNGYILPIGRYGGWFDVVNCYINDNPIDRIYFGYITDSFFEPPNNTNFLFHELIIWEISFRLAGTSNWLIGFQGNEGTSSTYNDYTFTMTDYSFGNSGGVNELKPNAWLSLLFDWELIDNSVSSYTTFTFADNFNYNAPYSKDTDSVLIEESYFTSSNTSSLKEITYFFEGGFYCNDIYYDTIKLCYQNAYGVSYINGDSNYTNSSVGRGYWTTMLYGTTENDQNYWKLVAYRKYTEIVKNNVSYSAVDQGSLWVNNLYKTIKVHNLTDTEQDYLAQFNSNLTGENNGFYTGGGNNALVNVFSLFATAFSSWADILSIQIIPGITIGFMMFLPLISGIIILIIWIVKR